jgi:hypothetical protein
LATKNGWKVSVSLLSNLYWKRGVRCTPVEVPPLVVSICSSRSTLPSAAVSRS